MASKGTEANRVASPPIFDCESLPIPPGTKCRARLPRGLDEETSPRRIWWLLGGAVVVALVVGVGIGRFLLP
jgi:hypothetical protein